MLIVRLFVVLFAVIIASVVAGIVVTLAVLLPAWSDLAVGTLDESVFDVVLAFGALFLSGAALLPALLVVLLAEVLSVRTILFYATVGALAGAAIYAGLGHGGDAIWNLRGLPRRELEIMAAAGIIAGCVYWLIAGRNAGRWRAAPPPPPAPPAPQVPPAPTTDSFRP